MFSYLLYGFIWLISFLPLRVLYVLSDGLYYALYYVVRYRRSVTRMNLKNAFPEKETGEIIKIEKGYYRSLADIFVELYKSWHMSAAEMKKHCVFKHTEILEKYYAEGKSVIGVMGHYGNWEWMASYALWMNKEVDFLSVYKPMHNKVWDKMMFDLRALWGCQPVPKNDILRRIVRNRKEGRLFFAGFIADQTPNKHNLNFWMDFLNQDTPILIGTERIAAKFNLPVISLYMRKIGRGYYEVDFVKLCDEPARLAPGELTVMYTRMLEEQIKKFPEYWLWSHRRWKHKRNKENGVIGHEHGK